MRDLKEIAHKHLTHGKISSSPNWKNCLKINKPCSFQTLFPRNLWLHEGFGKHWRVPINPGRIKLCVAFVLYLSFAIKFHLNFREKSSAAKINSDSSVLPQGRSWWYRCEDVTCPSLHSKVVAGTRPLCPRVYEKLAWLLDWEPQKVPRKGKNPLEWKHCPHKFSCSPNSGSARHFPAVCSVMVPVSERHWDPRKRSRAPVGSGGLSYRTLEPWPSCYPGCLAKFIPEVVNEWSVGQTLLQTCFV